MNEPVHVPEHTIVIVGGGYAGALVANRTAGRLGPTYRVVLVSERDEMIHRNRLHEVAAGHVRPRYPLAAILRRNVERVQGRVVRIEAGRRVCRVRTGEREHDLAYDTLVYAVGSSVPREVPQAHELRDHDAAARIAEELAAQGNGEPVVVVGGGLSGIETASEIAEAHPRLRVTLVAPRVAPDAGERARDAILEGLRALCVTVRESVRVERVEPGGVVLEGGERLPSATTVWTAGLSVPSLARDSGLPVDASGRLVLDETLRVAGHPEIFGCGDAAVAPASCNGSGRGPVALAAATAMPMGAHVADTIVDLARGRPPRAFRFEYFVWCVSLGRARGVAYRVDADNAPTGRVFGGAIGLLAKRFLSDYGPLWLRLERWIAGAYWWPGRFARVPARLPATTTIASASLAGRSA